MKRQVYCTSFCNYGHYVDTGRPIGHECFIIPPAFLLLEREGKEWPAEEREKWSRTRYFVDGKELK